MIEATERISGSRSTNGSRRGRAEMRALREALVTLVAANRPMTVRQVFYQAVSHGLIAKSEAEYKGTIVRLLTDLRKDGELPYDWIADNTRWMRKPSSYSGLRDMLEQEQQLYRRSVWDNQDAYVEVWLEKDALAGVLYEVTEEWDVPLMVTRGYPSFSFIASAAEAIAGREEPVYLYYFGDHDTSGRDIPRHTEAQLRELSEEIAENAGLYVPEITFEVVAVQQWQIEYLNLPTRPTKQQDPRAANFTGESVEVDAIPPDQLRVLVRESIEQHIDTGALEAVRAAEEAERETLAGLIDKLPGGTT